MMDENKGPVTDSDPNDILPTTSVTHTGNKLVSTSATPVAGSLKPGDRVGSYEIIDKIAQGGSATIYRAEHVGLQKTVALKVMAPVLAKHPDYVEMFVREARATAKLKHPNIVQTYDTGTCDGVPYLAMELINGGNLTELIRNRKDVSLVQLLEIMLALADALNYGQMKLHLTHGDIKPENVIIDLEGKPHLADFGLSETIASKRKHAEHNKTIYITPLYASPETLSRCAVPGEPYPDIYSFGCMMFHLITGNPPFQDHNIEALAYSHMQRIPLSLKSLIPDINYNLSCLVEEMLSKNPVNRPGSWKEVHTRLASIIEEIKQPIRYKIKKHLKLIFTFSGREQLILLCFYSLLFIYLHPVLMPVLIVLTLLMNYLFKSIDEPQISISVFKDNNKEEK